MPVCEGASGGAASAAWNTAGAVISVTEEGGGARCGVRISAVAELGTPQPRKMQAVLGGYVGKSSYGGRMA